jgi:hypothetical protein
VHILFAGDDVSVVKVLDNEWRWEPLSSDPLSNDNVIASHGDTVEVNNHPIMGGFYLQSYLVGSYHVTKEHSNPLELIAGPDSILLDVNGTFRDGGFNGWTPHTLGQERRFEFDLDTQSGSTTPRPGVISSGGGTEDGSGLGVLAISAAPQYSNISPTVKTVTIEVGGDVGIEGEWSLGGSLGLSGTLAGMANWAGTYSWSRNLGVWLTNAELRAIRGASN